MAVVNLTLGFAGKTVLDQVSMGFRSCGDVVDGTDRSGKIDFLCTLNRMNDTNSGYHSGDVLLATQHLQLVATLSFRRCWRCCSSARNPFLMSIMDNVLAGVRAHKTGAGALASRRLGLPRSAFGTRSRISSAINRLPLVVSSSCCAWPVRLR